MRLDDGREVVVRLELPLPLPVAAKVMKATEKALDKLGYTDIVLLMDGTGRIVGTPPAPRSGIIVEGIGDGPSDAV